MRQGIKQSEVRVEVHRLTIHSSSDSGLSYTINLIRQGDELKRSRTSGSIKYEKWVLVVETIYFQGRHVAVFFYTAHTRSNVGQPCGARS